jgi:sporulation protein YlmC with PRC-barrel domain
MTLRLSDLVGKIVYDEDGAKLGTIEEVRVKDSRVEALIYGPAAWFQRLAQWRSGRRVEWLSVVSVDDDAVRCLRSRGGRAGSRSY